jgi:gluconokinase
MGSRGSGTVSAYVVMGVSGCGKTSVARLLAQQTGGVFLDADDFHPPSNKKKMAAGIPLADEDRWGWLDALNAELKRLAPGPKPVFLACSALREVYRKRLASDLPELQFIYLDGNREVIQSRLDERRDHFMPASLLDSQFALLEEPAGALRVSIDQSLSQLVSEIMKRISVS